MTLEVQVINSLPTFQQPLPSLIPVTISIDDSNKIVQGPLFTYVAPPIVDLERHKVEVVVKWDKEMDYASASVVMG